MSNPSTPTDPGIVPRLPTHLDLPPACAPGTPLPPECIPITHKDLPATDGLPVENAFQPLQAQLLTEVLGPVLDGLHPDGRYFVGQDVAIYWQLTPPEYLRGCKAPDWFYAPHVPTLLDGEIRRSYVLWNEGVPPALVVEVVSAAGGAEERDRTPGTGRFWAYEQGIRAGEYLIFDPFRETLEGYELTRRQGFAPISLTGRGRIPVPALGVELGMWHGTFRNCEWTWLRAWTPGGMLLPTAAEQTDLETGRAEAEARRADKLAAKLRELGVDPEQV